MKKNFFGVVVTILLLNLLSCATTSHNSRNSVDWAGVYTGVIPSAGGMGINVKFTLNADETYTVEYQYIGQSDEIFPRTGTFTWNPQGDTIILDSGNTDGFPPYYKVGENTLTHLDLEGNIITGDLADMYILHKQQ
jgi:uncharacterized lipoprotein NlpE involved in copper resistance